MVRVLVGILFASLFFSSYPPYPASVAALAVSSAAAPAQVSSGADQPSQPRSPVQAGSIDILYQDVTQELKSWVTEAESNYAKLRKLVDAYVSGGEPPYARSIVPAIVDWNWHWNWSGHLEGEIKGWKKELEGLEVLYTRYRRREIAGNELRYRLLHAYSYIMENYFVYYLGLQTKIRITDLNAKQAAKKAPLIESYQKAHAVIYKRLYARDYPAYVKQANALRAKYVPQEAKIDEPYTPEYGKLASELSQRWKNLTPRLEAMLAQARTEDQIGLIYFRLQYLVKPGYSLNALLQDTLFCLAVIHYEGVLAPDTTYRKEWCWRAYQWFEPRQMAARPIAPRDPCESEKAAYNAVERRWIQDANAFAESVERGKLTLKELKAALKNLEEKGRLYTKEANVKGISEELSEFGLQMLVAAIGTQIQAYRYTRGGNVKDAFRRGARALQEAEEAAVREISKRPDAKALAKTIIEVSREHVLDSLVDLLIDLPAKISGIDEDIRLRQENITDWLRRIDQLVGRKALDRQAVGQAYGEMQGDQRGMDAEWKHYVECLQREDFPIPQDVSQRRRELELYQASRAWADTEYLRGSFWDGLWTTEEFLKKHLSQQVNQIDTSAKNAIDRTARRWYQGLWDALYKAAIEIERDIDTNKRDPTKLSEADLRDRALRWVEHALYVVRETWSQDPDKPDLSRLREKLSK